MKITYNFYIRVESNGSQEPLISIEPETYNMLAHIGRGHMYYSDGVKQELEQIQQVLSGAKEIHSFGGDDWCLIDFKKDKSMVINGFDEFEPFEIESIFILQLMKDWCQFLIKYENGDISGIIPPDN